jgi:hypothetical protein
LQKVERSIYISVLLPRSAPNVHTAGVSHGMLGFFSSTSVGVTGPSIKDLLTSEVLDQVDTGGCISNITILSERDLASSESTSVSSKLINVSPGCYCIATRVLHAQRSFGKGQGSLFSISNMSMADRGLLHVIVGTYRNSGSCGPCRYRRPWTSGCHGVGVGVGVEWAASWIPDAKERSRSVLIGISEPRDGDF